ncbi:MAG: flagellar biosynthesis protein FliQ [Planctomycetaceae bacterium]|nr:flagellar biosynthesis protein FliQ [Planctomycetaceae bacterium]MCA9029458.1 flagellar biosynthesis protein FliQ [Planctomycetaceae bacterium]MCA9042783.1 flagellar biosynthesis protein FliQ [Planctomycetaceae bacterium]MCB9952609.1 flagellar biosynthesis protein FliQ [Planctomycetaceae bacterium]
MEVQDVLMIGREVLLVALLLSLPAVGVSLVVGVCVSVLQAATSIQEQTLSFVPRIIAVALVLMVTLPWSLRVLTDFSTRMFGHLMEVSR